MRIYKINLKEQTILAKRYNESFIYRFEFKDFLKEDLEQIINKGIREIEIQDFKPTIYKVKKKYTKNIKTTPEIKAKLAILGLVMTEASVEYVKDKTEPEIIELSKEYITRKEVFKRSDKVKGAVFKFLGLSRDEKKYKYNEERKELHKKVIELTKSSKLYPVSILKKYKFIK
jgi:mannitol-1-phosphate/altronate dehydrogenase